MREYLKLSGYKDGLCFQLMTQTGILISQLIDTLKEKSKSGYYFLIKEYYIKTYPLNRANYYNDLAKKTYRQGGFHIHCLYIIHC